MASSSHLKEKSVEEILPHTQLAMFKPHEVNKCDSLLNLFRDLYWPHVCDYNTIPSYYMSL